jgi:hypothetical protein
VKGVFLCTLAAVDRNPKTDEPDLANWQYCFEGANYEGRLGEPRNVVNLVDAPRRYEVGKRYSFTFPNVTPD